MAGKKILVADDSLTIQKVIRLALSNEGYDIQAVSDGNDALQQISVFRPDVVLIDVSLPGQTAFEVKRAANEKDDLRGIRFILMSSAFEKVDDAQAKEVHFHNRLTKPFDPAHLRQVLTEVLGSSRSAQPAPPPPQEPVVSLWDKEESPKAPMLPTPSDDQPDADIKHLTESTIRMSGLDDLDWSINESAKKSADLPPIPPPTQTPSPNPIPSPAAASAGFPPIPPRPAGIERTGAIKRPPPEPSLPPLPSMLDSGGSSFPAFAPPSPDTIQEDPSQFYHNAPEDELPRAPELSPQTKAKLQLSQGLSDEDLEAIVRERVNETLERVAHQLVPQIAERIIKEEIHKLLNEKI